MKECKDVTTVDELAIDARIADADRRAEEYANAQRGARQEAEALRRIRNDANRPTKGGSRLDKQALQR